MELPSNQQKSNSFSQLMSRYKNTCNKDNNKEIFKPTFIPVTLNSNKAKEYSANLLTSERDRLNESLVSSHKKLLNNSCLYLPNFLAKQMDTTLFDKLKEEMKEKKSNIVNWDVHYKLENPQDLKIFEEIVNKVSKALQVKVKATRINYYSNGNDWKHYHRDSHKMVDGEREDITIGISLGASRELSFLHVASNNKFSFPQNNGDLFAFTDEVNSDFKHGVPKTRASVGERFSIIIWGVQIIKIKDQKNIPNCID